MTEVGAADGLLTVRCAAVSGMALRSVSLLSLVLALSAGAAGAGAALPPRLELHAAPNGGAEEWDEPEEPDPFAGFRAEDQWPPAGVSLPLSPPVTLADGTVTGQIYTINDQRTTLAYQGIPFGEPTNGSLRFMVRSACRPGQHGLQLISWSINEAFNR